MFHMERAPKGAFFDWGGVLSPSSVWPPAIHLPPWRGKVARLKRTSNQKPPPWKKMIYNPPSGAYNREGYTPINAIKQGVMQL